MIASKEICYINDRKIIFNIHSEQKRKSGTADLMYVEYERGSFVHVYSDLNHCRR